MTVRAAKYVDIPLMTQVYQDAHRRSIYAETATLDLQEVKQLFARSLQRHGHNNYGGSLVLVSERDSEVNGFLIGLLDSVYPCVAELMATDLLFIQGPGADPRDARTMLQQLIAWAEANPKVIEIHLGITNAVGDWERTAKLYERLGLTRCGGMFRRELER